MDNFMIILHIVLCFTTLPLCMKGWWRVPQVLAVILSLCATPLALVIGPLASFLGLFAIWAFCRIFGFSLH